MLWAWNVAFVCNTESIFLCVSTSEAEPPLLHITTLTTAVGTQKTLDDNLLTRSKTDQRKTVEPAKNGMPFNPPPLKKLHFWDFIGLLKPSQWGRSLALRNRSIDDFFTQSPMQPIWIIQIPSFFCIRKCNKQDSKSESSTDSYRVTLPSVQASHSPPLQSSIADVRYSQTLTTTLPQS